MGGDIRKLGRNIIEFAEDIKDAAAGARVIAGEMEKTQKELADLSWDEASKGLKEFTESLSNVPPIFDLALRRRQAALAAGGPTPSTPSPAPPTSGGDTTGGERTVPQRRDPLTIIINNPAAGVNGREIVNTVKRALRSDPEMRYLMQRGVGVAV